MNRIHELLVLPMPSLPMHHGQSLEKAENLTEEGVNLAKQGQVDAAIARFRTALQLRPDYAKAYHNLAIALAEKGRFDDALETMNAALRLEPDYVEAFFNLGNIYMQTKRHEDAVAAYRQVIHRQPKHGDALNNLAMCLTNLGHTDEAVILLKHLARIRPDLCVGLNNLGLALTDLGEYDEAIQVFEQALRLDPVHAESHANLANAYKARGELGKALAAYNLAIVLQPGSITTRWNRSLTLLQMGDYAHGWAEYESRRQKPNSGIRPFSHPLWDGSPLQGRSILIHMEQGFGDMLQGIRFAPLVKECGGRVLVTCPDKLMPLLQRCAGIDLLIDERSELPRFDVHAPLWSLPAMLKTTLATVPAQVPYLFADPALIEHWRGWISEIHGFKIGIAWQGNPLHPWDRHRSIPLRAFAPLAEVDGVRLVSLQKGHGSDQVATVRSRFDVIEPNISFDETTGMFMDTAAIMKHLDLVVTADTSIAHLAGGLGVPTWVALAQITDWRWLHQRDDSPWYPTVRLFQQPKLGDWGTVFAAMVGTIRTQLDRRRVT